MAHAHASVRFSLPFLPDNSADSCPVTPGELVRYVRAHAEGGEVDPRQIAFVRTAQVRDCRYWMWRYQVEGVPSYALVMEDGDRAWLSNRRSDDRSPEEVLVADYESALLDA